MLNPSPIKQFMTFVKKEIFLIVGKLSDPLMTLTIK